MSDGHGDKRCRLITLTGLGPDNLQQQRRFLAPFETIERLEPTSRPRRVRRSAWRAALQTMFAREGGWTALASAERAAVDVLPHQLEPALAVLRGLGTRVLLADAVGLGKTIQAAIIVAELVARGAASRALFVTPAGLRDQWADELLGRFGMQAEVLDMRGVRTRAAVLPPDVNPWDTEPLAIASLDYVKRPEVLPAVLSKPWDIVLVDEAHLVGPDSDRQAAVSALCQSAAFVLLLTATPHSGDSRGFESLCALGAHGDPLLVFRRGRDDVSLAPVRKVHRRVVVPTPAESQMHAALAAYAAEVRAARGDDGASALLVSILQKRAWSSAASLRQSIERRVAALGPAPIENDRQLTLPLDTNGESDDADAPPDAVLRVPALADIARERRLLVALAESSARAARAESKLRVLARLLRRCRRLGERAIVFTEYRDTLLDIQRALPFESAVLHGGLDRQARRATIDRFVSGRTWLLLSTDAGSEGLNLHQSCRVVIHVELPWNPVRLEQRIGRVDRIGQTRSVHAWCFLAGTTGEMQVLDRLKARVDRARRDIAVADPLRSSSLSGTRPGTGTPLQGPPSHEVARAGSDRTVAASARRSIDLTHESHLEAHRLSRARQLSTARPDARLERATWVAVARGRTRIALGLRVLLLVETALEDAAGRRIATGLRPWCVSLADRPPRRDAARFVSALLASLPGQQVLRDHDDRWHAAASKQHAAFWLMCLERNDAVRRTLTRTPGDPFQPGLFERRADRARHAQADELGSRLAQVCDRLARCQHQLGEAASASTAILALVP